MKITTLVPVYTDGSVFNNQKAKGKPTVGGIGVYFGDDDKKNVSEPFTDKPVTNNKCELTAVIVAIQKFMLLKEETKRPLKLIIHTDSQYTIKCMNEWILKWKKNNWKTASGKTVMNQDLIMKLDDLLKVNNIEFKYVPAHTKEPSDKNSEEYRHWYGNECADKMAKAGTEKSLIYK